MLAPSCSWQTVRWVFLLERGTGRNCILPAALRWRRATQFAIFIFRRSMECDKAIAILRKLWPWSFKKTRSGCEGSLAVGRQQSPKVLKSLLLQTSKVKQPNKHNTEAPIHLSNSCVVYWQVMTIAHNRHSRNFFFKRKIYLQCTPLALVHYHLRVHALKVW